MAFKIVRNDITKVVADAIVNTANPDPAYAAALRIAISVFGDFLMKEDMEIILVVFDKESFVLSDKVFSDVDSYIDENYGVHG